MKILIIGGTGQLGQSLINLDWPKDFAVLTPSRIDLDLLKREQLHCFVREAQPEFVINASAWTDVNGAEQNPSPAHELNGLALNYLAEACNIVSAKLIHISTDYVFDGAKNEPYSETDETNPLTEYGKTKLAGEDFLSDSDLKSYYIVRTSWLYSRYKRNFVKTILAKALRAESSTIVEDQVGSPTFAGDLAAGLQSLIRVQPDFGIYHFSNEGATNWYEFGKMIYELSGQDANLVAPIKTSESDLRRPKYSVFDLSKWQSAGLARPNPWQNSLAKNFDVIQDAVMREVR